MGGSCLPKDFTSKSSNGQTNVLLNTLQMSVFVDLLSRVVQSQQIIFESLLGESDTGSLPSGDGIIGVSTSLCSLTLNPLLQPLRSAVMFSSVDRPHGPYQVLLLLKSAGFL